MLAKKHIESVRHLLLSVAIAFVFSANNAGADTWAYDPVKTDQIERFGDTRIVLTTDARKNRQYPDFILSIYFKNELRAKYRGLAYEQFFSSPDNSYFLGLSNSGLPGSAVVLFDKYGRLMLEVKHGFAAFDYCDKTATLVRQWFDKKIQKCCLSWIRSMVVSSQLPCAIAGGTKLISCH